MGIRKFLIGSISLVMFAINSFGQGDAGLKIGDKIPDVVIHKIINRAFTEVSLKDLHKDRLLIINFWATWCIPCLFEMKTLDSLKTTLPDKFNVLSITQQDAATIQQFLGRSENRDIKTTNLVIAAGDVSLAKLFPHRSIPHNIWIDKNGIVRGITTSEALNVTNILGFSKSDAVVLKEKKDILDFDALKEFHLGDSIFAYRSIITPYIDGINGGMYVDSRSGKVLRYFQWNCSILHMYHAAYSNFNGSLRYNLVEVRTQDSLKFFYPVGKYKSLLNGTRYKDLDDWMKDYAYSYALTLPERVPDSTFQNYMFNDLNRRFGTSVKIEYKNTLCQVVTKVAGQKLVTQTKVTGQKFEVKWNSPDSLSFKNATIGDILNYLFKNYDAKWVPLPFINETKENKELKFSITMDFSGVTSEISAPEKIVRELSKYGYRFKAESRPYPILVIFDKTF